MSYDLHLHSNESRHVRRIALSPAEVVYKAKKEGLDGLAITDHDTRRGIAEAQEAAEKAGIDLIPGIEMSFSYILGKKNEEEGEEKGMYVEGDMLGYFIDPEYPRLIQIEEDMEKSRRDRDSGLMRVLDIPKAKVLRFIHDRFNHGSESVTRDDIVDYLIAEGIAENRTEAYEILKPAGQSIVQRYKTDLEEVCDVIREAGGILIPAHIGIIINDYQLWPKQAFESPNLRAELSLDKYDPERDFENALLPAFLRLGVKGFEIYPYNLVGKNISVAKMVFFNDYAEELNERYGLINRIRGSDCHFQPQILTQIGCWQTEKDVVEQLKAEHLKRTKAL